MEKISLYIHIPFCESKCYYCDFTSFAGIKNRVGEYVESLKKEICLYRKELKDYKIESIFLGGGTPSSIDESYIEEIFKSLRENFDLSEVEEITIEANPGTIDDEKVRAYKRLGINRVSMGVQSFNNRILKSIGRIHTREDVYESLEILRKNGMDNINIDLMFALPNQTMDDIVDSLNEAIDLGVEHISYYSLIIEEGTKMHSLYEDKEELFPTDELDRKMYHKVKKILEENAYKHYELSNYSKNAYESRHNLVYWDLKEYIGLGLSSHSNFKDKRFSNSLILNDYIEKLSVGEKPVVESENISMETKMFEYMIMGIRKIDGISKKDFKDRFKTEMLEIYSEAIEKNLKNGLLIEDKDRIYLSEMGLDLCNMVELDFLK